LLENPVALGTEPTKLRALVDSGDVLVPLWGRDARWGIVGAHAMRNIQGMDMDGMRGSKGEIKDTVAEWLAKLLWTPIENLRMDASLSSLGIDSIIASEFRHWMYQTFKKNVSMMELLAQDMTIEKLAAFLKE
jgi:acyl carrier protein